MVEVHATHVAGHLPPGSGFYDNAVDGVAAEGEAVGAVGVTARTENVCVSYL